MDAAAGIVTPSSANMAEVAAQSASEEAALIKQAQAGSLEAFSRIVARYQGGVFNYLRRRGAGQCDAEDLAQETFVRAWTAIETYNPRWRISTWLYAIATRLAIDHLRTQRSRRKASPHDISRDGNADPVQPVLEREARLNLWSVAQRTLSDDERSALWLKYAENLSSSEIARVMGRNAITVRVMLFRARRVLAAALDEHGGGGGRCEDKGAKP
jgi:RNA polymerase sigma-70 factor (ECF subfamily)